MNTARFVKGLSNTVSAEMEQSRRRAAPVAVAMGDPTDVLARLVFDWPARDVRLDTRYVGSHEVNDTSELWVKDVVSAVRLREERRTPGAGVLVVGVDFPSNMAEYERFNSVVQVHNQRWAEAGCPEDCVDPWSGDVVEVEGYVDYARPSDDIPLLGDGGGPLDSRRPHPVRSMHITVEYRATEWNGMWKLGFVARDVSARALCWNEESGPDLAALVRRATQMFYGNPFVVGNEGPLSDGLPLLVQGRKAALCERRNARPQWMSGAVKRGVSAAFVETKIEEVSGRVAHNVFGFWIPAACVVMMLVWSAYCLNQTWGEPQGPHAGMGWFLAGEVVLSIMLWASSAFATHVLRAAEGAKMRSTYL